MKKYKDSDKAHLKSIEDYNSLYRKSIENPDKFWSSIANRITWYSKWDNVSDVDFDKGNIKWFENAKLNASYNCLDRHIESGHGDQNALIWEGNNPESDKTYTYKELLSEVSKFANVLKSHNIKKGDRVCLYMQMNRINLLSNLIIKKLKNI